MSGWFSLLVLAVIVTYSSLCSANECPQASLALANATQCQNYTTTVLTYDPTVNSQSAFDTAVQYVCGNANCFSLVRAWTNACRSPGNDPHPISTIGCTVNGAGQYCWSVLSGGVFPEVNNCNSSAVFTNIGCPDDCRTAFRSRMLYERVH
ncbi:uncharacterized protein [Dysidea avara]|uniref:uncharacterized protein n=1 Tax=Dysidea avara TaxID=196820 RepID=UPI003321AC4D